AANGFRVLTVDWDLEAPGLAKFFHPFLDQASLAAVLRAMLKVSGVYDVSRPHAPAGGGGGRTPAGGAAGEAVREAAGDGPADSPGDAPPENGDDRSAPGVRTSWGIHGRTAAFTGQRSLSRSLGPEG
ncbi:hypothetical protein ACWC5I_33770, partial [Kitasatospora sp. NPDC001574]